MTSTHAIFGQYTCQYFANMSRVGRLASSVECRFALVFSGRTQNIAPATGFVLRLIVTGDGGGVATIWE